MAIQGPIPVAFDQVYPHGAYVVGEVEKVKDFDASKGDKFVQARDKHTNELVWQVAIMDADPSVKATQKTAAVKLLAPVQPVPPSPVAGSPFTPVELDGLTVTPYVNSNTGRLAYSIKATGMKSPGKASAAGAGRPAAKDAA